MKEERAEEILEALWMKEKEGEAPPLEMGEEERELLLHRGRVKEVRGELKLTDMGNSVARKIVRCHRLAERLLADVLDSRGRLIHERACRLEHLIDPDLEEDICSLLGHPPVCPHNKLIPRGRCCQRGGWRTHPLLSPLSQLSPGQRGKVAYIHAQHRGELQKLVNMGIFPGASLRLIHNLPSFVFEVERTQFAVDKEIADAIYVRLEGE